MRVIGLLAALLCASAAAQELPPIGTYQKGDLTPKAAWPDPSKLGAADRLAMELLLRQAHEQKRADDLAAARSQEQAAQRLHNVQDMRVAERDYCAAAPGGPECKSAREWLRVHAR